MSGSRPPGPALVAAAADADPVTLLVTAWLSAGRSESTRVGYARDIGITPPRRPGRAPSWLTWCREQGVHPVTGVTALHVARYARQLEAAGGLGEVLQRVRALVAVVGRVRQRSGAAGVDDDHESPFGHGPECYRILARGWASK